MEERCYGETQREEEEGENIIDISTIVKSESFIISINQLEQNLPQNNRQNIQYHQEKVLIHSIPPIVVRVPRRRRRPAARPAATEDAHPPAVAFVRER